VIASTQPVSESFYLAVSGAIPVLWVSIGLASAAISAITRRLNHLEAKVKVRVPFATFNFSAVGISVDLPFNLSMRLTSIDPVTRLVRNGPTVLFIFLVASLGAVAEFMSLLSFLLTNPSRAYAITVLTLTSSLVLMTGLVLLVSMVTASSSTELLQSPDSSIDSQPTPSASGPISGEID